MKGLLDNLKTRRFDLRADLKWISAALGLLLVANLGFYLFLNMPRLNALGDLRSARASVRSALKVTTDRINRMNHLIQTYDEEVVRLADFYENRLGTQTSRMTAIQREVRDIAGEFRIDPENIDYVTSEVEGTDLMRFQITVPLTGGYPNLRHFLNRIESSEHLLTVDSVELTGSREGGAMLSLTVKMATYFKSLDRERRRSRSGPA